MRFDYERPADVDTYCTVHNARITYPRHSVARDTPFTRDPINALIYATIESAITFLRNILPRNTETYLILNGLN